jgi:uracil-DNA glycosylase
MATRQTTKPKIPGAAAFLPPVHTLPALQSAVQRCQGCDLYRNATQAVFGEADAGPSAKIRMMMVGEQPGDREDKEGHPFVGPAGKFLDRCLEEAGIDRKEVYVTNAVKHFKWEPRGKARLHKKPNSSEIFACSPWLRAETEAVKPQLIVCLGATASQSLLGAAFRVTQSHGAIQNAEGWPPILATAHPASILRARTDEDRHRQTAEFIEDLRSARAFLRKR